VIKREASASFSLKENASTNFSEVEFQEKCSKLLYAMHLLEEPCH